MTQTNQEQMIGIMKEILQDDYTEFDVKMYSITERLETESLCRFNASLLNANGNELLVEGEGVGSIDALFNGLKQRLGDEFPSLKSLTFSQFNIRALLTADRSSKAEAEATVGIYNSEGVEFVFQSTARSISRAGIEATISATEYFVNSEKTFVRLHEILEHYKNADRIDLVDKYTELMARVVQNTSYSEVVESIQNSLSEE